MKVRIVVTTKSEMKSAFEGLFEATDQETHSEGRRRLWRMTYAVPGRMDLGGSAEAHGPIYITTRDINTDGLSFLNREPLSTKQKVILNLETDKGEVEIPATVIHCTATVGSYKVGVRFDLLDPDAN